MVSEDQVKQVLVTLYREFIERMGLERSNAINGEFHWRGLTREERSLVDYALEGAELAFKDYWRKACRTAKK